MYKKIYLQLHPTERAHSSPRTPGFGRALHGREARAGEGDGGEGPRTKEGSGVVLLGGDPRPSLLLQLINDAALCI